jgi:Fic family protein
MARPEDPCANPKTEYGGLPSLDDWPAVATDVELWDRHLERLRQARVAAGGRVVDVLETAIRAAAADSGAIEGLYAITAGVTRQVAEQRDDWRSALAEGGAIAPALFDAQLTAYHLATQLAQTPTGLTEAHIRQLHHEIRQPETVTEDELGRYKVTDNCTQTLSGTVHRYAPATDAPAEVATLLTMTRTESFKAAHPAVQAAYVHYGLAAIHPFSDGNGRVARAVASAVLQNSIGLPLIIYADEREKYISALEDADSGNYVPFNRFIFDRVLDSIRFVTDGLLISPDFQVDAFSELFAAQGGLSFQQMVELAGKLVSGFHVEFGTVAQRLTPPAINGYRLSGLGRSPVSAAVGLAYVGTNFENTYGVVIDWTTPPPAAANHSLSVGIAIAKDANDRFPFVVFDWDNPSDRVEIRLEDIYPAETTDLTMRRHQFVERKVHAALRQLYVLAAAAKQRS